ncbi:MAG: type II/IV secretion system protein [Lentisphaeria bacterium]|nr:type II/IV secretion system protein [Lentisphaeria bacterium]
MFTPQIHVTGFTGRTVLRAVLAVVALVVTAVSPLGAASVPLADGRVLDREIVSHDERGLVVRSKHGTMLIRWHNIDPSFRLHPATAQQAPPAPPPAAEQHTPARSSTEDLRVEFEERLGPPVHRYTLLLGGILALFWSHMFAVRLVAARNLGSERIQRAGLLIALFLGLPPAVALIVIRLGVRGLFRSTLGGLPPAARPGPPCQLHTWAGEPVVSRGAKLSSGLQIAQELLSQGIVTGASDIHFDTTASGVDIAYRVDGMLRAPETIASEVGRRAMAAIKTAAGMDLGKRHENQDGACHLKAGEVMYDLRIARAWAMEGETMVVRLLRAGGVGVDLGEMGMIKEMVRTAAALTTENSGIVIMAGPTGSGKTTTIYALLRMITGTGRRILTIEDPVEYRLEHATQISINPKMGATFASALKASMRHDPDVILVGEVRDAATMDVAFQAALTGHLVFSSIHATSLLATIGRLHELGLSSYMINTGLQAIICQRLVRKLCPTCRESYVPTPEELAGWNLPDPPAGQARIFYKSVGCKLCEESGYHGRVGVFRLLKMDNSVREHIKDSGMSMHDLQAAVERSAEGTLPEYAERLLQTGVTSLAELHRTAEMFDKGRRL